jgi:two-component system, LytTR family, response regulator
MNSTTSALRVFVTDDEALARRKLLRFLGQEPGVAVAGQAGNGPDTVAAVAAAKPDLLFLDIQMTGMDGFAVVDALGEIFLPRIVFVTAHDEYAIQALEIHAFGYLLKPFDQMRFSKVLSDARRHIEKDRQSELQLRLRHLLDEVRPPRQRRLLVEEDGRGTFLALDQIDWAEADRNYLKLHAGDHVHAVRGTIESIEERVDPEQFLRINRSSLVRIGFVRELHKWTHGEYQVLLRSGQTLLWTRRYLNRHSELVCKL